MINQQTDSDFWMQWVLANATSFCVGLLYFPFIFPFNFFTSLRKIRVMDSRLRGGVLGV
jgi:hypothetical protein